MTHTLHTREQIDHILRTNDRAVERAMIVLFKFQTASEQRRANTDVNNDVGFSMVDARVGTRFARWLLGMNDNNQVRYPVKSLAHPLAARVFKRYCKEHANPMARARHIALKHSAQLVRIANGEVEVPETTW